MHLINTPGRVLELGYVDNEKKKISDFKEFPS